MNEKCNDKEKCEINKEENHTCCHGEPIEIMPLVDIIEDEHDILSVEAKSCLCRKGRPIVFRRCFQLNSSTDISKIHAKTHDGVLTLTLPKSEDAKVHKIQVTD